MKNILFLTLLIITTPIAAFAYSTDGSGACSFHSGVNCSAGSHTDGSTICNDGWVDSSVKYYEVQECRDNSMMQCPTPHLSGYSEYSSCESIQNECTRYDEQRKQICIVSGRPSDSESCQPLACEEYDICRDEVKQNKDLIKSHDQCLDTAVSIAEAEFERQQEMNRINDILLQDALKEAACGSFAYYSKSDEKCYCDAGYEVNTITGQCSFKTVQVPEQPVFTAPASVKETLPAVPVPVKTDFVLNEENSDTIDSDMETKRAQRIEEIQNSLSSSSSETDNPDLVEKVQEDTNQKVGIFTKIVNFLSKFKFW